MKRPQVIPHTPSQTIERLQAYGGFDLDVLESVAKAADIQNYLSFADLESRYHLQDGPRVFRTESGRTVQTLEIRPENDFDEGRAIICHIPYANGISDNWVMHAIRLAGAFEHRDEGRRVKLMVGNPSSIGDRAGALTLADCWKTAKNADLSATVEPTLEFLESQSITRTDHIGYSFGADKALTAIGLSTDYNQSVESGVIVEAVTAVQRKFGQLTSEFGSTREHQQAYIKACTSIPYMEFWDKDNVFKALAFVAGMGRMSNIAIAKALTEDKFSERASVALGTQPGSNLHFAWGTLSELAPDDVMADRTGTLQMDFPGRVTTQRLEGMHHAGVDDIDLFAAIMLQGLKTTACR